ncbi:MAG: hypothetical protein K6U11_08960 [bacterium]|nr:hypothetical protein [bacterium]
MGTARKMAQRVRINIDELLDLLARCAIREWEIFYYYTVLGPYLQDIGGVRLQSIIERARMEDCSHFERLVSFIFEMGGVIPVDFRRFPAPLASFLLPSSCWGEDQSPDERAILQALCGAEKYALQSYLDIHRLTEGKDAHTASLISSLLEDEIRHRRQLLAFLTTEARYLGRDLQVADVNYSPSVLNQAISDLRTVEIFKVGT